MTLFSFTFLFCVGVLLIVKQTTAQNVTTATTPGPPTTQAPHLTTPPATGTTAGHVTTMTPDDLCNSRNSSCADCLAAPGAKCLWCMTDSSCKPYPTSKVLPPSDMCALDEARWGVCWLNFEAMIISVSVIGGIIILGFTICICCCCCCKGNKDKKYDKEESRWNEQKMERKAKSDERKAERKDRLDEIRRKYGLMKDEPCQRFDA